MINSDAADQDAALLQALRSGNQAAFAALVQKYHNKLLLVARLMVGELWAEEVVQDAWLSVYRAIDKFEGRSALQTWLYTIVKNQARTHLRSESRLSDLLQPATPLSPSGMPDERFLEDGHWQKAPLNWGLDCPADLLAEEQLRHCIQHTLKRLSTDQLAVFTLRDLQQMEMDDICNILELTASNARVLLHRARLTLMQVIERYQETGEC